ncbi:hypothetical protein HPB52_004668 [Rhipicephalus sanguineus]|uniref:Uncharacterized protein n=1 Tax=Rhipicephalus sanguineus TaxID=34632 RepID=A0A9D4T6Z8_RHISA|nr:hypothetical protein HPB52_004668 [Rhipicephalus sanguineus]
MSETIGDSQLKCVHNHFDPASPHSPAFICQPRAYIDDIGHLLDFVPKGLSNLILHVGSNFIAGTDDLTAYDWYVALLDRIRSEKPDITMLFAIPWCSHEAPTNGFSDSTGGRGRRSTARLRNSTLDS